MKYYQKRSKKGISQETKGNTPSSKGAKEKMGESSSETPKVNDEMMRKFMSEKLDDGGNERQKFKKIDMSTFDGTDPNSWLFQAYRYFQILQLNDKEKLTVVAISFQEVVIKWHRAMEDPIVKISR